jgi:glucuronide carrier protein
MTQEPGERAKLSASRVVSASVTILLIAVVVSPQIERAGDLQRSLTVTTIALAAIGLVLYLVCFATTREKVERRQERARMRETMAMMVENRPLVLLCASSLLFLTGNFSLSTAAIYYARDVLGNADLYILMTFVQTVAMVAAAVLAPTAVATVGKKRAYVLAGVVTVASAVVFALAPGSTPAIGVAAYAVLGLGLGLINTLVFALQPDTVDYGEWQNDVRAEGGSYALLSFTRKAGQAIGGATAAYTIGLGGYVSGAAVQSDAALNSIRIAAGIVPAVAVAAAAAIMVLYPLTEERFREITQAIARRRLEASA